MRVVDLSHSIHPGTPVYPGTPAVRFQTAAVHATAGYAERRIEFSSHTSTHMDAPYHMLPEGATLDQLPVSTFLGRGFCIDCTAAAGRRITIEDLKPYAGQLPDKDFLLLYTGWQHHWGSNTYFGAFPTLDDAAVEWLLQFPWKGIGVDTISVDPMEAEVYSIHHAILGAGRVIVENLTQLDQIVGQDVQFIGFPLKLKSADGSPIRAVALVSSKAAGHE